MENASGAMGGGTRSDRVGRWGGGGTMDGAMSSGRSFFCFFLPDFHYSYVFLKLVQYSGLHEKKGYRMIFNSYVACTTREAFVLLLIGTLFSRE